VRYRTD